ncbi:kinase-like domain-containing protein [Gilbertella persicaria]|uniref:kinase-like domain-containing protein n=1 Tax=Gilbertella persicaria TaxID=101096 RepID=UPI00221F6AA2|nr:kinase-like domain-containing protein [Gilbertella persicaria]KAI8091204.1 kinase-like domain-containing protein [Gilbertella persicaria]
MPILTRKRRLTTQHLIHYEIKPVETVQPLMDIQSQYDRSEVQRIYEMVLCNKTTNHIRPTKLRRVSKDTESMSEDERPSTVFDVDTLQISENNVLPCDGDRVHNTRRRPPPIMIKKEPSLEPDLLVPVKTNPKSSRKAPLLSSFLKYSSHVSSKNEPKPFIVTDHELGIGQMSLVRLGKFGQLQIACKSKRPFTNRESYDTQADRELEFAAKLSACRYTNKYLGWTLARKTQVEEEHLAKPKMIKNERKTLYIVQKYIANGDARSYLYKRETKFHPQEVLQASICLFSALTDAHKLDIGFVDLKLENFLIDSSGAGWLTDFGSCIEFKKGKQVIDLNEEDIQWTENVASPEMLIQHQFSKASDVFMATIIVAEMMTSDLSDDEFQKLILRRHAKVRHEVAFSSDNIHKKYRHFFPLLKAGLVNDPSKRPTAEAMLTTLLQMKK